MPFTETKTMTVVIKLSGEGKMLLKTATRLKIIENDSFRPTGAAKTTVTKTLTLKR